MKMIEGAACLAFANAALDREEDAAGGYRRVVEGAHAA